METSPASLIARLPGALLALLLTAPATSNAATAQPVDLSLTASGLNYDDLCFWRHPTDVEQSLVFVTSKDLSGVEVFRLATGSHVTTLAGYGEANNCDVVDDLLVTTDAGAGEVTVHRIPDLALLHTFTGLSDPQGIAALDRRHVYVTEKTRLVRVFDLDARTQLGTFDTGIDAQEGVVADADHQRVLVADDAMGRIRVFSLAGALLAELSGMFGTDAEGLAIYRCATDGYLLASDQSNHEFEVFDRLTLRHLGSFLVLDASGDLVNDTDGIDVFQAPTAAFPGGIFGACDDCSGPGDDMDLIRWERVAAALGLLVCPDGRPPIPTTTTTSTTQATVTTTSTTGAPATTTSTSRPPVTTTSTTGPPGTTTSTTRTTTTSLRPSTTTTTPDACTPRGKKGKLPGHCRD